MNKNFKTYLSQHKKDYSFCMVVSGKQHTGKTTFCEQKIVLPFAEKFGLSNIYIYDIQGDWKTYYDKPIQNFEEFANMVKNKQNSLIVFEEASIFFTHNPSDKISRICSKMLVDLYHKGNIIILNFHSLRRVPLYVADLTTYFTLFKTDDTPEFVENKFQNKKISEAFKQVIEHPEFRYHLTIKK